jgi:hypothetical protein
LCHCCMQRAIWVGPREVLHVMLNFVYVLVFVLLSIFDVMFPSHCFRAVFSGKTH